VKKGTGSPHCTGVNQEKNMSGIIKNWSLSTSHKNTTGY
jgi:hypothetical protein